MQRAPFSASLAAIASAAHATIVSPDRALHAREMVIELPLELTWARTAAGCELFANPPRWRWQTAFDAPLARVSMTWREIPRSAADDLGTRR